MPSDRSPRSAGPILAVALPILIIASFIFRNSIRDYVLIPIYIGLQYLVLYVSILPQHAIWLIVVTVVAWIVLSSLRFRREATTATPAPVSESARSRYSDILRTVRSSRREPYYRTNIVEFLLTLYLRRRSEIGPSENFSFRAMRLPGAAALEERLPPELRVLLPYTRTRSRSSIAQVLGSFSRRRDDFYKSVQNALDYLEDRGQ